MAPSTGGIYIVRGPRRTVWHVGKSGNLQRRLNNHLLTTPKRSYSSFAGKALKRRGDRLRRGFAYAFLEVPDWRLRALAEHLAVGVLCPKHLGTHKRE